MGGAIGFHHLRLRSDRLEAPALWQALQQRLASRLTPHGAQVWGVFQGLFGLHSRELILVLSHPLRRGGFLSELPGWLPDGISIDERYAWVPAARPEAAVPLGREGLYVLRFFDVRHADADEIASISRQAWETFEVSNRYASQPLALFKEQITGQVPDPAGSDARIDGRGRMLLVTWYDSFLSWQTSRQPAPEATASFQRRAALTSGTIAYACRLLSTNGER